MNGSPETILVLHVDDELGRQNEQLEQFASVVSHDLRNPLTVAEGRLELAREECDSEHLEPIGRAHDRMRTLIDDLLALARQDAGVTNTDQVELATVVESCWKTVETRDASLFVDTEWSIYADENRLKQLFENLLRNAIEHGGEDVTITVSTLENGFYVRKK